MYKVQWNIFSVQKFSLTDEMFVSVQYRKMLHTWITLIYIEMHFSHAIILNLVLLFLFISLAGYVEAIAIKLGFEIPHLSARQVSMRQTKYCTYLVSISIQLTAYNVLQYRE